MISLVTQNRLAQFAARFETQDDGSLIYFHPDGRAGLPCTQAEAESLIAEFAQTHSTRGIVFWAIGSGAVMGVLEASNTLVLEHWAQYAIFLAPFLLLVRDWHHARLRPLLLLEGRIPAAPPHTVSRVRQIRLAALPASLIVSMLLLVAALVYYAAQTGWEIDTALIAASNLLLVTAWVMARGMQSSG